MQQKTDNNGPLSGFRIIEIAGIGPSQYCGMLLADMGAEIIRIGRPGPSDPGVAIPPRFNLMNRSRPTIELDLKTEAGREQILKMCEKADAIFEGFRPGAMERLGLGPDDCMNRNPRLVYGRISGWGQEGPLAKSAGHDANYMALSGALASIGEKDTGPVYPLNLVADFGGGGAYLAIGILAAMLESSRSGKGQVVDAAMVDGSISMMTVFFGLAQAGLWQEKRCSNILDGGAPFVRPYRTADGEYIVVSPLENRFFEVMLELMGITDIDVQRQNDPEYWPVITSRLEKVVASRSRKEWCDLLEGTDACVAPVLNLSEVAAHHHNHARQNMVEVDGIMQPAPAPRFSRTPSGIKSAAGDNSSAIKLLRRWGLEK